MVEIVPSLAFKKAVKHLDDSQKEKLQNVVEKILSTPDVGTPLQYFTEVY